MAYADHLQTIVDQGNVAVPVLEAALMAGIHQEQVPTPAGGVIQPPGGGGQHVVITAKLCIP